MPPFSRESCTLGLANRGEHINNMALKDHTFTMCHVVGPRHDSEYTSAWVEHVYIGLLVVHIDKMMGEKICGKADE